MDPELTKAITDILPSLGTAGPIALAVLWKGGRWVSRIEEQLKSLNEKMSDQVQTSKTHEARILKLESDVDSLKREAKED